MLLLIPFQGVFGQSPTIWDEIYPELRHRNFDYPEKLDEELLAILYKIVREVGGKLHIHSDFRPGSRGNSSGENTVRQVTASKHALGIAVDFRLDDYTHQSRDERLFVYYRKTEMIEELFHKYDIFDEVGFGIYPYSWNPFWHIDVRGAKARWCRNKRKRYVGYEHCKGLIKNEINSLTTTPRILQHRLWGFDKDSEIQPWEI